MPRALLPQLPGFARGDWECASLPVALPVAVSNSAIFVSIVCRYICIDPKGASTYLQPEEAPSKSSSGQALNLVCLCWTWAPFLPLTFGRFYPARSHGIIVHGFAFAFATLQLFRRLKNRGCRGNKQGPRASDLSTSPSRPADSTTPQKALQEPHT